MTKGNQPETLNHLFTNYSLSGTGIRIHAISTGLVAVKRSFRENSLKGYPAVLSSFIDPRFTEWMPIWTWVIEHPEGTFLLDTGENANVNDKDYFKSSGRFENWMNTTQFRFKVNREEEIDKQLEAAGLSTSSIDKVILTHLHLDHIDGLRHFPDKEIMVNRLEWEKPYGDLPKLYPEGFKPALFQTGEQFEGFDARYLTKDQKLIAVHTPGHTWGHISIVLETDQAFLFFAGDVVYFQDQLVKNNYAAANVSPANAAATYKKINALASRKKLILLPSHEFAAADRLKAETPLTDTKG